ncbi:class I SAM-dependent methyltransferase [Streptomyces sp. DHE7-1]|nr:class I SAM-dependent methyltransferase [Streptomyces sp. DHE7-1]
MAEGWTWDETLFAGTAVHYERGRLPYAPALVPRLAEVLAPDGTGRLLDVGCGPGTLALPLSHLFAEVVGVDPDPGMIAEAARRSAGGPAAGDARWVRLRAEDLPGATRPLPVRRTTPGCATSPWPCPRGMPPVSSRRRRRGPPRTGCGRSPRRPWARSTSATAAAEPTCSRWSSPTSSTWSSTCSPARAAACARRDSTGTTPPWKASSTCRRSAPPSR